MRLALFLLLSIGAGWAQCAPQTIDDFTTGRTTAPTILRTPNTSATTFQTGDPTHLLGGVREFFYQISTNTYSQPSEFDIVTTGANSGALVVTNGVEEFLGSQLAYGVDTHGNEVPLHFFPNAGCDRFRVTFDSNVATLTFGFEAYTPGPSFADFVGGGVPEVVSGFPRCVDFPFANFVSNTQGAVENFSQTGIDLMVLVLSGGAVGGNSFAITKIETTDSRLPPNGVPCVAVANN
jgi:hypothetical protein